MRTGWLKQSIYYVTGSVLYALSVSAFSTPNDIAPGGATGLGVMAHALFGIPVGAVIFLVNVPLLTAAYALLSRGFALRTAVAIALSSVLTDGLSAFVGPFTEDRLLAALCGGLLSGVGVGLLMLCGASTGGSEIAAALIQKHRRDLSMGRCILLTDSAVILLSALVFGELSASLYAAVSVFTASTVIDRVVYGREEGRLLLIVSRRRETVARAITEELSRGVTVLSATGGYSGQATSLLLCAVSRVQLPALKRLVRRADREAFLMVVTTQQVLGEGFLSGEG